MRLLDFNKSFSGEEACERHLKDIRTKEGITCSSCGEDQHYWDKRNKCWICKKCGHKTTLTAGTLFHGSKLPLLYWFTTIHLLTSTKRTFSAAEIQRQLGHKRYQPIWEMVHKIRSVMGQRDDKYDLEDEAELDEAYFTNSDFIGDEQLKRGLGSQRKTKVLVMVESKPSENPKKGKKQRKVGHIKMKILPNLEAETVKEAVSEMSDEKTKVLMDASTSHNKVDEVVAETDKRVVKPKDGHIILPWVHTAISNAKAQLLDMYHGIKEEFLQLYLDEFCYKFNRRYFGERTFDRLMLAAVCYKPTFQHRSYKKPSLNNG